MRPLDVKDLGALVAWSTGQRVPEGSYGPVGQHPPDLARRTLSRMLLLVFERLDDLERSSVRADPATAATSGRKVPTRTSHDDLAREVSEWESGVRRPSGFRDAPEAIPNGMTSETTATIDEQDSTRCCLCSGPLDHQAMDNTAWPHLSQCKTCGATQSTGMTSRQPHGGSRSTDTAREALLLQIRMNHDRAAIDRDREALLAWSTNKTIPDPDHSSPKWPNQITRGLARILLWACKRLDVDRVLIEGHENIVRNLSTRVEALEYEQRIQRLEENERIINDAKTLPKSVMPGYVADPTTAALEAQADKVSDALRRVEYYQRQFDGAIAQRDEARAERDAQRDLAKAALESAARIVNPDLSSAEQSIQTDRTAFIMEQLYGPPIPKAYTSVATQAVERPHINKDGLFQSDKYPTCPPGKVPLAVKDKTAQDLLWMYAQRRREVDAEFADDLEFALKQAGYEPTPQIRPQYDLRLSDVVDLRAMEAKFRAGAHHAVTRLAEALDEMTTVNDCRQVADVFADVIGRDRVGRDRVDDEDFDLNKLIFEAKRQVKGK